MGAAPIRVYLAGPPYAEEYRRRASELLSRRGAEPIDPMRRDYRGRTAGNEVEIVEGDLADIDSCDAMLASFAHPDEGTAMEAWYAHGIRVPVVAYTGGTPLHPMGRLRRNRSESAASRTRSRRSSASISPRAR